MQNGFTLIEVLILAAIAGILLAVAIPAYQEYGMKEKCSQVGQIGLDQECKQWKQKKQNPVIQFSSCISGYVILPNGNQLLDTSGHGIKCQG